MNSYCAVLLFSLGLVGQSKSEEMECEPGQFLDQELKECQKCQQYTFSSTRNRAASCAQCNMSCFDKRNAYVLHPCNSTHDTICQCKDGYFALSARSQCRKHTVCPENCLKYSGSATRNSECYEHCPIITNSLTNSLLESSTASTNSTGSAGNTASYPLDVSISGSNETASNNFVKIGLPILIFSAIMAAVVTVIYLWKKKLKLRRAFTQRIYQIVPRNRGNQRFPADARPQLPPRNTALAGNDQCRAHQRVDEHDQQTASMSLESDVLPVDNIEGLSHGSRQCGTLPHVPDSQILPTESVIGHSSSQETDDLLHESERENNLSVLSLPECVYGRAHLPLDPADGQNSSTRLSSEELATSRPGSEDLQGSRAPPDTRDLVRVSTKPCARVQPLVQLQPVTSLEADVPQPPPVNDPDHIQLNHQPNLQPNYQPNLQPNYQPGAPSHIVDVEDISSLE